MSPRASRGLIGGLDVGRHSQGDAVAKTNAMRELERAGIAYEAHTYELDDETGSHLGERSAALLGLDPDATFKTLVCSAGAGSYAVFCIPVAAELDLKKAARAAQVKSLSMLPVKELLSTTGYVRGGCSPVGMKKGYPTFIDETAQLFERIGISGGRIGLTLVLDPAQLATFTRASFRDLTEA